MKFSRILSPTSFKQIVVEEFAVVHKGKCEDIRSESADVYYLVELVLPEFVIAVTLERIRDCFFDVVLYSKAEFRPNGSHCLSGGVGLQMFLHERGIVSNIPECLPSATAEELTVACRTAAEELNRHRREIEASLSDQT